MTLVHITALLGQLAHFIIVFSLIFSGLICAFVCLQYMGVYNVL